MGHCRFAVCIILAFKNKNTGEEKDIDIKDDINLKLSILYSIIEDFDHLGLSWINPQKDKERDGEGIYLGKVYWLDFESLSDGIEELRKILRERWAKETDLEVFHLESPAWRKEDK